MKLLLAQQQSSFIYTEDFEKFFTYKNEIYGSIFSNIPSYSCGGNIYVLNSVYHDWLNEYNIFKYTIIRERIGFYGLINWYIVIPNANIAVLFKLTWL